jgi:hypothetical protein
MTFDLRAAAELCTQEELNFVTSVRAEALRHISPKRLQWKIARARNLRDKFRDLAHRQAREARQKAPPRGKRPARSNTRTVAKARLFAEVLRRLRAHAAKAASADGRARKSGAAATPSRASHARATLAAGKRKRIQRSHATRLHAHVGSRNRRMQSRRDAR